MTFDEQMSFYKDLVDNALDKYTDFPKLKQSRLFEAM